MSHYPLNHIAQEKAKFSSPIGSLQGQRVGGLVFCAYKDGRKLGEAKNMEDAIQIIKASVGGSVREIKMSDW